MRAVAVALCAFADNLWLSYRPVSHKARLAEYSALFGDASVAAVALCALADDLWLSYRPVSDKARLSEYRALFGDAVVAADASVRAEAAARAQLENAAAELATGLTALLGRPSAAVLISVNEFLKNNEDDIVKRILMNSPLRSHHHYLFIIYLFNVCISVT